MLPGSINHIVNNIVGSLPHRRALTALRNEQISPCKVLIHEAPCTAGLKAQDEENQISQQMESKEPSSKAVKKTANKGVSRRRTALEPADMNLRVELSVPPKKSPCDAQSSCENTPARGDE